MTVSYKSPWMTEELRILRDAARKFLGKEFTPHIEDWLSQKRVPPSAWRKAGEAGLLCPSVPEEYGGVGGTLAHETVILEELENCGIGIHFGAAVHSGIVAHYLLAFGTEDQKHRWLPRMVSGELIGAIAMTEPNAGSDLQAMRTTAKKSGDHYVLNGQKTFITNGHNAGLIIVAAKTDPHEGGKGISLLVLETEGASGFRRGRNLDKIGMQGSDTAELFFGDVVVPQANLLGGVESQGFAQLMNQLPQERLLIAVTAVAAMERAVELTSFYVKDRTAFGRPVMDFQNTAFRLAERKTEAVIARVFVDYCICQALAGDLDTVTASMAKWWTTDKQFETTDVCLQLFGGYGYITEYPIARMFVDARVQRIYGGTNEIMKLVISRSL